MISDAQRAFAVQMAAQARASNHIFPGYAAAEACLESGWGTDKLAVQARNVFSLKKPAAWTGDVIEFASDEIVDDQAQLVEAWWPVFPSYAAAFAERMNVLRAAAVYRPALAARTGVEFLREVSGAFVAVADADEFLLLPDCYHFPDGDFRWTASRWATDPARAAKVLATHNAHPEIFS